MAELLHRVFAWTGPMGIAASRPKPPLGRRLGQVVLVPRAFPAEVVAKAKICLLGFCSCAFEARDLRWSRQTREVVPKQAPAFTIEAAVEDVDASEDASAVIQLCGAGGCGGGR